MIRERRKKRRLKTDKATIRKMRRRYGKNSFAYKEVAKEKRKWVQYENMINNQMEGLFKTPKPAKTNLNAERAAIKFHGYYNPKVIIKSKKGKKKIIYDVTYPK